MKVNLICVILLAICRACNASTENSQMESVQGENSLVKALGFGLILTLSCGDAYENCKTCESEPKENESYC